MSDAPLFVGSVTESWPAWVHLRWSPLLRWHTECERCSLTEHAGHGPQTTADPAVIRRARALAIAHRDCKPEKSPKEVLPCPR